MDFRDKIIIRVGESVLLEGRYTGKPAPSITWYQEDEELKANRHIMFKNTLTSMSMGLLNAKREHSGRYMVVVENSTGSRKGVCNIIVVGMISHPPRQTFIYKWLLYLPMDIPSFFCHVTP